jgi:hypothetical protein
MNHEHRPTSHVYGFHAFKRACRTLNAAVLPQTLLNAFMRHSGPEATRK